MPLQSVTRPAPWPSTRTPRSDRTARCTTRSSPTPSTILYAANFTTSGGPTDVWSFTGTGLWRQASIGSNFVFRQSLVGDTARAVVGVPTDDQTVDVRARPITFAGTDGAEPFALQPHRVGPTAHETLDLVG